MNRGPYLFLGSFLGLALSWLAFVLMPQFTLGRAPVVEVKELAEQYPIARPGLARQGAEVYRANGCYTCHSQQVRPAGGVLEVLLAERGTNTALVIEALAKVQRGRPAADLAALLDKVPQVVASHVDLPKAQMLASLLNVGGAAAEVRLKVLGADLERGWGRRRSVAQDYIHDYPVMPGSQRLGPDLANIGLRQPSEEWHLWHLYNPAITTPKGSKSVMPPYRYLFETRRLEGPRSPSPDALKLPAEYSPGPDVEIVPRPEAKALVAYLLSLRSDVALFETPLPKDRTNAAPAAATNAPPSGVVTNAPAQ
jgi:cbb3-type cytochrome oxidase cytochrome c subunit